MKIEERQRDVLLTRACGRRNCDWRADCESIQPTGNRNILQELHWQEDCDKGEQPAGNRSILQELRLAGELQ
jgi:hypothetical protein